MADTDNKEVFGKGCPMEGSEPTGSGNLIAHNDDDTTELDQAIDQAPLMGSTPLIKRPHEAGDGMHPLEDFGTEAWTHHPALPKMFIKPGIYNGRSDWADYLSHFNKCAILGGWNDKAKCIMLVLNLRAAARRFYAGLSQEESDDYSRLTAALKRRFGGKHRQDAWLFQLEMRKRKSDESILELLDDIWQMTQRAYCNYDHRSLELLALKHFCRVINADTKARCFESKCSNIKDAVNIIERYSGLYEDNMEERRTAVNTKESRLDTTVTATNGASEQCENLGIRNAENLPQKQSKFVPGNYGQRRQLGQVTCYGCGEKGHYRSKCPKNKKANLDNHGKRPEQFRPKGPSTTSENYDFQVDSKISSSTVGKDLLSKMEEHSLSEPYHGHHLRTDVLPRQEIDSWQNGIFTQGHIEGITLNFLVDTGSVVTIISAAALQRIPQHLQPVLRQTQTKISGVGRTSLEVAGISKMTLVFDGIPVDHEVLIAHITLDAILGQDILLSRQCKVDLSGLSLKMQGKNVSCWTPGKFAETCSALAKEEPSGSAKTMEVDAAKAVYLANDELFQPSSRVTTDMETLVMPSVISMEDNTVHVGVISYEESKVCSGQVIRSCEIFEQPHVECRTIVTEVKDVSIKLTTALEHIVNEVFSEMTENQKECWRALAQKYQDVFAASKSDLGQTSITKYSINTGNSFPIQTPARRPQLEKQEGKDWPSCLWYYNFSWKPLEQDVFCPW